MSVVIQILIAEQPLARRCQTGAVARRCWILLWVRVPPPHPPRCARACASGAVGEAPSMPTAGAPEVLGSNPMSPPCLAAIIIIMLVY